MSQDISPFEGGYEPGSQFEREIISPGEALKFSEPQGPGLLLLYMPVAPFTTVTPFTITSTEAPAHQSPYESYILKV